VRAATDRAGRLAEVVTCENFRNIIDGTAKPANALEHADYLIAAIAERTRFLGSRTPEGESNSIHAWIARAWLPGVDDLTRMNSELERLGLFTHESVLGFSYQLNIAGWQRALELKKARGPGNQAFVAMWFAEQLNDVYVRGIAPALRDSGYQPYRVDHEPSADMIDNRVIAQIRRSQLLVTDCTGARPSAYFEAGLAMGLGIDVIWCCNSPASDTETGEYSRDWSQELAFDTRQYPHILWSTPEQLREELVACIRARGLSLEADKWASVRAAAREMKALSNK
jgi:hypothetical protein